MGAESLLWPCYGPAEGYQQDLSLTKAPQPYKLAVVITPILQTEKVRATEVNQLNDPGMQS